MVLRLQRNIAEINTAAIAMMRRPRVMIGNDVTEHWTLLGAVTTLGVKKLGGIGRNLGS
jgi:hypothetical protein